MRALLQVLRAHDATKPHFIGERYGLGRTGAGALKKERYSMGNDYVTMGGGVAYSGPALQRFLHCLAKKECGCTKPDEPDDMALGYLFSKRLEDFGGGVRVTHEEDFHQARPEEYNPVTLAHQHPVSFHRFDVNNLAKAQKDYFKFLAPHADTGAKLSHEL